MQLIRTHDGLIALKIDQKIIWCDDVNHASRLMAIHYRDMDVTLRSAYKDICYAIDHMCKTGDTVAEFGVLGGFMYTTTEVEYEF
jgi:hypothetical protein